MPHLKSSQVLSARVELAPQLENFPLSLQLRVTVQSSDSEIGTTKTLNITGCLRPRSKATPGLKAPGHLAFLDGHRGQRAIEPGQRPQVPDHRWVPQSANGQETLRVLCPPSSLLNKLTRCAQGHTGGQRRGCQDPVPALQRQKLLPRFVPVGLKSPGNRSPGGEWAHPSCPSPQRPLAPSASLLSAPVCPCRLHPEGTDAGPVPCQVIRLHF